MRSVRAKCSLGMQGSGLGRTWPACATAAQRQLYPIPSPIRNISIPPQYAAGLRHHSATPNPAHRIPLPRAHPNLPRQHTAQPRRRLVRQSIPRLRRYGTLHPSIPGPPLSSARGSSSIPGSGRCRLAAPPKALWFSTARLCLPPPTEAVYRRPGPSVCV